MTGSGTHADLCVLFLLSSMLLLTRVKVAEVLSEKSKILFTRTPKNFLLSTSVPLKILSTYPSLLSDRREILVLKSSPGFIVNAAVYLCRPKSPYSALKKPSVSSPGSLLLIIKVPPALLPP